MPFELKISLNHNIRAQSKGRLSRTGTRLQCAKRKQKCCRENLKHKLKSQHKSTPALQSNLILITQVSQMSVSITLNKLTWPNSLSEMYSVMTSGNLFHYFKNNSLKSVQQMDSYLTLTTFYGIKAPNHKRARVQVHP